MPAFVPSIGPTGGAGTNMSKLKANLNEKIQKGLVANANIPFTQEEMYGKKPSRQNLHQLAQANHQSNLSGA